MGNSFFEIVGLADVDFILGIHEGVYVVWHRLILPHRSDKEQAANVN